MRIFIVSPNFPPEPGVSSMIVAQTAQFMAAQGHDVSVVTGFPSRPQGRLYPGYKRRWHTFERPREGYQVVRCFGLVSSNSTLWSRFLENASFGLTSSWYVLTARRPDVLYANTWAIFATGMLALAARLRGFGLVLNIQDLYPESLIAQKRISRNGITARGFQAVDRWIAKASSAIIVPAPSFAEVYHKTRRLSRERLHYVPNWLGSTRIIADDHRAAGFRQRLGIPAGAAMIFYGGNIGAAAGVETVIQSFRYLGEAADLYLTIAGDGANLRACRKLAAALANPRIQFCSPWPADETSPALGAADILILPTQGSQSLTSIPSKLIAYLLAARPVLALALPESDLARIIQTSGCGWVIAPDQPPVLADKIRELLSQPRSTWRSRGLAGREFALANFTGDACLPRIAAVIEEAARNKQPAALEV